MNRIFSPNFRYTHQIVKNLVDNTSARETILNAYLVPKWEISLRRDALISAAHGIHSNRRKSSNLRRGQPNGQITSGEIKKMFKISRQAAHKEIIKLIELNLIEQKGAGKAIHYVIK